MGKYHNIKDKIRILNEIIANLSLKVNVITKEEYVSYVKKAKAAIEEINYLLDE